MLSKLDATTRAEMGCFRTVLGVGQKDGSLLPLLYNLQAALPHLLTPVRCPEITKRYIAEDER